MKFKCILLAASFLLFIACKEASKEIERKKVSIDTNISKPNSKSTFEDLEGNSIALSDYKGKKLLLNFWATWCRPCIEEMPALARAQTALANENYVFLFASDQSTAKIKAFSEKKDFDFKYVKFNGAMADFEVIALPVTFIYNEDGKLVHRIDGATEWDSLDSIDMLKAIR